MLLPLSNLLVPQYSRSGLKVVLDQEREIQSHSLGCDLEHDHNMPCMSCSLCTVLDACSELGPAVRSVEGFS